MRFGLLFAAAVSLSTLACSTLFGVDFDDERPREASVSGEGGATDGGDPPSPPEDVGADAETRPLQVDAVAVGGRHACALLSTGGIRCWGANGRGQLGNGSKAAAVGPVTVVGLPARVVAIRPAGDRTCAILATKEVACWGSNGWGELGDGTKEDRTTPVLVRGLTGAVELSSSGDFVCARLEKGTVWCWGGNTEGQLGDGSNVHSSTPVPVKNLTGVTQIASGGSRTCALLGTGAIRCWGYNDAGQIEPSKTHQNTPFEIVGPGSTIKAVSVGWLHTCLLGPTGAASCRGYNGWGELGDGTNADAWSFGGATPWVSGLGEDVLGVRASLYHSCALRKSSGAVSCWGGNNWGQLGDGKYDNRNVPRDVTGVPGRPRALGVGDSANCAVLEDGVTILCWGNNDAGQLGAPSADRCGKAPDDHPCSATPVKVQNVLP